MSDFPKGGDISSTRAWLDKKGFIGIFNNWEADAILGLDKTDILSSVPGENGLKLWGLLNTARQTTATLADEAVIQSIAAGAAVAAVQTLLSKGLSPARSPLVDSGTQTPSASGPLIAVAQVNAQIGPPPPPVETTLFPEYKLSVKQIERNYYKEIKQKAERASGIHQFGVKESAHSILIYNGPNYFFKCSKYGTAPRCLLLELHDCGYFIPEWWRKRSAGGFTTLDYVSVGSPPVEKFSIRS